jgi:hypothetical protein
MIGGTLYVGEEAVGLVEAENQPSLNAFDNFRKKHKTPFLEAKVKAPTSA